TGTNLADATAVWTSFGGKATITDGKAAAALKIKLDVPKDAPVGFHAVRVATKRGVSNARLLCIDDLPPVAETATNRDLKSAQPVPVPCVVAGKADAEATDYFKVSVKAGQRVSFDLLGRRLGSAFDPQLTLLDAATGREIPHGFSNDAPGLQTDPRLSMKFDKAGDVVVAVRDVSYRGGADFAYRLRIGDFPCATVPLPMAAKAGTKAKVGFAGPYVEGAAAVEVTVPKDAESVQVAPKGPTGLHGWPVTLAVSDHDEALEKEPNDQPNQATRLTVPGGVTGRFEKKDDVDHYVFAAKKGQRLVVEAHTVEYGSPSDAVLTLKDAKGGQLQVTNPANPPRLDFTASADGDYTVVAEHLHSWGGVDEAYRVTVTPFRNDFALTLAIDRFNIAPGGEVAVPVFLTRAGYAGPIEVTVAGAKGVTGSVKMEGPAKPIAQPSAVLTLKADDAVSGVFDVRIVGKATVDGVAVERPASVRALVQTAMGSLPVPPREQYAQIGLGVTEKPPFTLSAKGPAVAEQGKPLKVTLSVVRQADFKGEVAVTLVPPVPGVTLPATKVAGDKTSLEATLAVANGAKLGAATLNFQGTAKHGGQDWSVRSAPVSVTVKK
ncbi:MAG: PPC domain-containing protein, partial [Gemmataceae bacterium]